MVVVVWWIGWHARLESPCTVKVVLPEGRLIRCYNHPGKVAEGRNTGQLGSEQTLVDQ